jgi:hypothetical protein
LKKYSMDMWKIVVLPFVWSPTSSEPLQPILEMSICYLVHISLSLIWLVHLWNLIKSAHSWIVLAHQKGLSYLCCLHIAR